MATTYIDQVGGLSGNLGFKAPVRVATTANITLSGTQTIDGVAVVADDRVLVKDQTNQVDNGIWIVASGTWSRAVDMDSNRDVTKGTRVAVTDGTVNALSVWSVTSANPIAVGADNITFQVVTFGLYEVVDEDDMASNSDTKVPTQQSVKAYVDNKIIDEDNMASNSDDHVPTQQSVKAYADTKLAKTTNRASLAGLSGASIPAAFVTEEGYEHGWIWDGSDLSSGILGSNVVSSAVNSGTETITSVGHALTTQHAVIVTSAVNGLSTNTIYWVIRVDNDNFKLATSRANALAGTAVNLTGTSQTTVRRHFDPDSERYVVETGDQVDGSQGAFKRPNLILRQLADGWDDALTESATPSLMHENNHFGQYANGVVNRFNRVFIGKAAHASGNRPLTTTTWIDTVLSTELTASSQLAVGATNGGLAITGASRSSDYRSIFGGATGGAQGLTGVALNDDTGAGNPIAAGVLGVGVHNSGITGITEAAEFSIYQLGTEVTYTPSGGVAANTTMAANLSFWPGSTNDGSLALHIGGLGSVGGSTWRVGIGIDDDALDTSLGSGGGGIAARFPNGAVIQWLDSSNNVDGELWAESGGLRLRGQGGTIALQGSGGGAVVETGNSTIGFFGITPVAAKTGWAVPTGTFTRTTYVTSTVTLPQLAERVAALIQDFHQSAGYGLLRT